MPLEIADHLQCLELLGARRIAYCGENCRGLLDTACAGDPYELRSADMEKAVETELEKSA